HDGTTSGRVCSLGGSLGERLEAAGPAPLAADRVAQLLPPVAVPLDVAMLQLHARPIGRLLNEPRFDFAGLRGIGLDLPTRADIPAQDDACRRLVREHASPVALGAVASAIVDMAAHARLEHALGDVHLEQVVFARKPAADALREDSERARDGG